MPDDICKSASKCEKLQWVPILLAIQHTLNNSDNPSAVEAASTAIGNATEPVLKRLTQPDQQQLVLTSVHLPLLTALRRGPSCGRAAKLALGRLQSLPSCGVQSQPALWTAYIAAALQHYQADVSDIAGRVEAVMGLLDSGRTLLQSGDASAEKAVLQGLAAALSADLDKNEVTAQLLTNEVDWLLQHQQPLTMDEGFVSNAVYAGLIGLECSDKAWEPICEMVCKSLQQPQETVHVDTKR